MFNSFIYLSIFFLETAIHIEHIDGYTILAHNPNAKEISAKIKETLANKNTRIKVFLRPDEICHVEEPEFKKQCTTYFENNFEKLAEEEPLFVPWKIPEDQMEIEGIMDLWCRKTNRLSSVKGLVLHRLSLIKCLELYGIKEDTLRDHLHIKMFSKAPITVVYNPHQRAVLLVRKAESDDLTNDMALSFNDVKMFILLLNDELTESGIKLIPLIVTDGKAKIDCGKCLNHVLSKKEIEKFTSRWNDNRSYFQTKSEGKVTKDFSKDFLAKVTSLAAATRIHYDYIPKFTSNSCGEMESLAVLLTREQMKIFYSQEKHMIIKGGFGCGKTIVAAAILEKISKSLGEHEKLFFICYDSRSALVTHMIKDEQSSKVAKVVAIHNKKGLHLSKIINDIKEKHSQNVHFVVDEYDGEDLDESEAETLNNMFTNNESLKEAFIMLIVQPIEKERTLNNIQRKGNMFHLLETMKPHQLTLVMRNSREIHELVAATKKILSEEKTIYIHQDDSKADHKEKRADREEKASQINDSKKVAKENQEVFENSPNEVTSRQKDRQDYSEETPKLGIDEAQAIAGSLAGMGNDGNKTITKFTYASANETGHKIDSQKPALFQLEERSGFQKVLSLIAIFENLDIYNKDHVVLHFDIVNDGIPRNLQFIFEYHFGMHEKVTNNYQEFASNKSILVCSYLTFRGLEHPDITIIVDRDIYFLQHFLVEALARCTSRLTIVVLQNSAILTKVTEEWNKNGLVDQWKIICSKDTQRKNFDIKKKKDSKIIEVTFESGYCGKMEDIFSGFSNKEDEINESKMKSHAKNLIEQNR